MMDIAQRNDSEEIVHHAGKVKHILLVLRENLVPVLSLRKSQIDADNTATGGIERREEIEACALITKKAIVCIGLVQKPDKRAVTVNAPLIPAILRSGALRDTQQQIDTIIGDTRIK